VRADQLLVKQGLAPSRSAAQRLIDRGAVRWRGPAGWAVPRKADELPEGCEIELTDDAELRWASRGGLKLDGALSRTGVVVDGRICLDVGQGTGGFTDVLLARGGKHVVGVDVGRGQVVERLRNDARVTVLEGLNARHLTAADLPFQSYDLVVGDLSFISLTLVLPALAALSNELLLLAKPQFELQPEHIGKGGLVKDTAAYPLVERRIRAACDAQGLVVRAWFESPVAGGDGNLEFFVWATR